MPSSVLFTKVLVANRGEIALRTVRALHDLGIASVAVYADDDAASPHVQAATAAVALGATGPAAYLDGARLIAIAQAQGCAVHVYATQHGGQEDQELGVVHRGGAGVEQVVAVRITDGPVIVLAASVYSGKGLFMKKAGKRVFFCYFFHHFHCKLIVVYSQV